MAADPTPPATRPQPQRLRLSRARGWRKPEGGVVVGRPSKWGNPYQAGQDGDGDRAYLVRLYSEWIGRPEQAAFRDEVRAELRGRDLLCWCPLDGPCHADVLLELANAETPDLSRFVLWPPFPTRT